VYSATSLRAASTLLCASYRSTPADAARLTLLYQLVAQQLAFSVSLASFRRC
jgi:hypothetical protein